MLRLVLDQYRFAKDDFGRTINFKIYDEMETLFAGSGYTGLIKVIDEFGTQMIDDISATFSVNPNTGTFAFDATHRAGLSGFLYIQIELSKLGEQTTTRRERVHFEEDSATV